MPYGAFQLSTESTRGIFGSITRRDPGAGESLFLTRNEAGSTTPAVSVGALPGGSHYLSAPGSCQITHVGHSGFNREQISWEQEENDWGEPAIAGRCKTSEEKRRFREASRLPSVGTEVCGMMSGLERGRNCDYSLSLPEQDGPSREAGREPGSEGTEGSSSSYQEILAKGHGDSEEISMYLSQGLDSAVISSRSEK